MDRKLGTGLALLAAVVAIVIVVAGGPLIGAIAVAIAGGLLGSFAPRVGRRHDSVGIR